MGKSGRKVLYNSKVCVCVCMFMLSGEWNGEYYCCASQLERKNPHMTFRATAFPLWFLFSFSSLPPALNHTMNANASVIPLRQEISYFEWCNCLVTSCISVSLAALRFKCKLVYFQKRKILADRKMPLKNITDVLLKWTRHHTCMQKHRNDLEFGFHGPFVSWCVCVCVGRRNPAGLRHAVHSWTWTVTT